MSSNAERDGVGWATELDAIDPLREFRSRFYLPPDTIYLDGNSLGLLSIQAEEAILRLLNEWKHLGVEGWLDGSPPWFMLAESVAADTAAIIGASADEVAIANSTTVNLHQLLATLFQPSLGRDVILADSLNFPSDLYAINSHLTLRGLDPARHLRSVQSRDGLILDENDLVSAMTGDVAIAVLPSVLYASGQLLDIAKLTAAAHDRGLLIGFDLSHSIGLMPHSLDEWDVDFAFWCSYKYLNGGPGATGGLYLNRRHFDRPPGLAGWFSSSKSSQFDMHPVLDPAPDAGRLHIGTPNILSLAPIEGSLQTVREAGIDRIRRKSLDLTAYLMRLADSELKQYGVTIANPREECHRGGHVALTHPEAVRLCKALKAERVIPDFRPPNIVRLAPSPLYIGFEDCFRAVSTLRTILETGAHLKFPAERGLVA